MFTVLEIEKDDILFCNLKLKDGFNIVELKKVVISFPGETNRIERKGHNMNYFFTNHKLKSNIVEVLQIDIIKKVGKKQKTKSFTIGKKSDEIRNKITGAYE